MLYDFILIDKNSEKPLYRQIYFSIRNAIENSSLKKNTKLPSIRRLSNDLNLSKTTITAAYDQLCAEGYIKTKPQSGYFVEAEFDIKPNAIKLTENKLKSDITYYEYDFSGKSIDEKITNLSDWKKYIKEVLNQNYLLTSYGEPQGEEKLRIALQKYSVGTRSVNTKAENIVVGAGMQPLLFLICSLLGANKTVAVSDSVFLQSEFVFKGAGYKINYCESDEHGITVQELNRIKPDIIFVNPNYTAKNGTIMPITRRLEIISWAKKNNALIVEDDYNGELRYFTHPMPCLQNYDNENTVYLGSFSKVLLPSVRIGYMVLPDKLAKIYNEVKTMTNQTASKVEQLALAKYIENGKIDIHLRKARRIYLEKSKKTLECVNQYFSDYANITFNETSLYISINLNNSVKSKDLSKLFKDNSILTMTANSNDNTINLSFSGIAYDKIEKGVSDIAKLVLDDRNN